MASKTKADELKLRVRMPPHIRKLMVGKRIFLMGAMLDFLEFPDKELISDITNGFKLSGWMPESNLFPRQVKSPSLTVEALKATTGSFNEKVWKQLQIRQEPSLEEDTWNETVQELEHGWIWEDSSNDWSGKAVARRFGIKQNSKTRVIDDCSISGLNMTVGTKEKFALHSIDQLCSMLDYSFTCAQGEHCAVLGRTYDLKAAYKQFGLNEPDRDLIRIAVNKPGRSQPVLLGLNALPFGAVGSVAGFLRISFAIWWLGVYGLGLVWGAYFDDYSTLTRRELESNTHWAVTTLFELLGVQYAREGHKAPPFSDVFRMLGLVVNLKEVPNLRFFVGHTDERREELKRSLQSIVDSGEILTKDAERIRGRMVFYECYVFGRIANHDLKRFGSLCRMGRTSNKLSEHEIQVVRKLLRRVECADPIPIGLETLDTWIIFTDGACESEPTVGSIGGVLIAPNRRIVHHFGGEAPPEVMERLLLHSKHPIHELEMIPVLVSLHLWGFLVKGSQVIHYIDNESVRLALLKGSGQTVVAGFLAEAIMNAEYHLLTKSWYARVASVSNIADQPSRGDFNLLLSLGSTNFAIDWKSVLASCCP